MLVSGLAVGSVYALVALGYNAIFRTSQVVNFAQGELLMIAALLSVGLYTWFGTSVWLAFPLAVGLAVGVGLLVERLAVRPLQGRGVNSIGWIVTTWLTMFRRMGSTSKHWDNTCCR